jgi:maltoporin
MQRALKVLGLSGLLAAGFGSAPAFAEVRADADSQQNTEQAKQAEEPGPLAQQPAAPPPAAATLTSPGKPKFGDMSTSGYFRGGFGASSQKGRMTCFALSLTAGLHSKYRLGNECEVWAETHFAMTVLANEDGSVATLHFMPTVFLPNENIGYSPSATVSSPLIFTTASGATIAFPNLYVDIQHIPWLAGGTAWIGTRYYKRESIYISDFFYWNPSGVGAGIEDVNLGKDLRLSYAAFAMDGNIAPADSSPSAPAFANKKDFGVRNDLQLRGIKPYESGEIQIGFQYILNYSNDPTTSGGWGATLQFVQKLLGGDNRLALQYGRGGGTGFGTLGRFYYPDFSLIHIANEWRFRALDVLTIQPTPWLGAQVAVVFQRDDLGTPGSTIDWYSGGGRVSVGISEHFKVLGEAGYDQLNKGAPSKPQKLVKLTIAPALTTGRGLLTRPELRLFATWAVWNEAAQGMGVDSSKIYNDLYPDFRSGYSFGLQAETWW